MKNNAWIALAALVLASHAQAQSASSPSRIWRCGNTYTNNQAEAVAQGCKLMEGGNITVVEGTRVNAPATVRVAAASTGAPGAASGSARVDSQEQRARDADARQILESELKKAESRQAELLREYNNGEPEKVAGEHRNHQKYLDRVAELKSSLTRNENDIAGIRREIDRLPASK